MNVFYARWWVHSCVFYYYSLNCIYAHYMYSFTFSRCSQSINGNAMQCLKITFCVGISFCLRVFRIFCVKKIFWHYQSRLATSFWKDTLFGDSAPLTVLVLYCPFLWWHLNEMLVIVTVYLGFENEKGPLRLNNKWTLYYPPLASFFKKLTYLWHSKDWEIQA